MIGGLEHRWVRFLDSDRWRRLARTRLASRLLQGSAGDLARLGSRQAWSTLRVLRDPDAFSDVETFCLFVGHTKSGGTLLGALLDAHPQAVVADEIDVLSLLEAGFGRDQIFHLVDKGARRAAARGRVTARRLEPYTLAVPGQWQGRHSNVRVIGSTRAGPTTRKLGRHPGLLDRLHRTLGDVTLRTLHVVRDPFDPISAMVIRGGRSLDDAIADYFHQCESLLRLRQQIPPDRLLTVRYEDLVESPSETLAGACRFLGLDAPPDYLSACSAIVEPTRRRERDRIEWDAEHVARVESRLSAIPFLAGDAS